MWITSSFIYLGRAKPKFELMVLAQRMGEINADGTLHSLAVLLVPC
jgi:hypothetical protein